LSDVEGESMAGNTLRIRSLEIVVDETPLPVNYLWCGTHEFTLSQAEDGQLDLQQGRGARVLGAILCVLGWPVLILGLVSILALVIQQSLDNLFGVLFLLGWGFPFSYLGVKLLGRRCRFDKHAGELTIRQFVWTRRRPLSDILAVQIINAGVFGSENSEGDQRFVSYQLNVVLDDFNQRRLFVAFHHDKAEMGKKGQQLSEFLEIPLLSSIQMETPQEGILDLIPPEPPSDLLRDWPQTHAPMPRFDLESGALGSLRLGDALESAEFLGQPDRQEQTGAPRWFYLDYVGRGFKLVFETGQFVELNCSIALPSDVQPEPGQGFSRPKLSGGIELTPQTSIEQVQRYFGRPESEETYRRGKVLTYRQSRFTMEFEFALATEKLLDWSVMALSD
jgi:hypothetical protein